MVNIIVTHILRLLPVIPFWVLFWFALADLFSGNILDAVVLCISFVIGLFVNAQLILPIVYGVPVSAWLIWKRRVTSMALISHLITPTLWFGLLFILGFVLQKISPPTVDFLTANPSVAVGESLATASLLLNLLSPKGLNEMWADYQRTTLRRYPTTTEILDRLAEKIEGPIKKAEDIMKNF